MSVNGLWEVGVDVGGTFTDVVARKPGGAFRTMKVPTTRSDPSQAVLASLQLMRERWGIEPSAIGKFVHGTTVATNAVLERKGARVGLVTTRGFKDVLEIGRQFRRDMYEAIIKVQPPVFLAPGEMRKEVAERVAADGSVLTPLDEAELRRAVDELVAAGAEAIAVVFLFSFANAQHELRAKELIARWHPGLMVSVSHEVDPQFREYERTVSTAFDAYVKPVVGRYIAQLQQALARQEVRAPLQVMQSRGGLASAAVAILRPVRLFLSGPAAGVVGGRIVGAAAAADDLITIDIGGTSADIALISRRKPLIRPEGEIDGYPVRVPMVDVNAIGAGGGSIARVETGGLRVGPQSAGSEPGPACYGRGGRDATVCDASLVLGYLDPDDFGGGSLRLDPALARAAVLERVANPLGIGLEAAALGIHRVLNAQMAEGIRQVSVRQGIDPRDFALVPLGGAGGLHATALANDLGMRRIIIPRVPGVLAAAGLLAAPVEHEVSAAFAAPLASLGLEALRASLARLDEGAAALMQAEGVEPGSVTVSYFADVCFIGQSYSLEIPVDPGCAGLMERLYEDFLVAHDRVFGHAVRIPAKIVAVRTIHRAGGAETLPEMRLDEAAERAELGTREIWVQGEGRPVTAIVLARAGLRPGARFHGPALVQQSDTTSLIEPGWAGEVDEAGNIILTREKR